MSTTHAPYQNAPLAPQAGTPAYAPGRPLSITSLVLGLASLVAGWTFLAPLAGLITGILALKREPAGRTMAVWGIVLSSVMLVGVALVAMVALAGLGFGLAALPFAFH